MGDLMQFYHLCLKIPLGCYTTLNLAKIGLFHNLYELYSVSLQNGAFAFAYIMLHPIN